MALALKLGPGLIEQENVVSELGGAPPLVDEHCWAPRVRNPTVRFGFGRLQFRLVPVRSGSSSGFLIQKNASPKKKKHVFPIQNKTLENNSCL